MICALDVGNTAVKVAWFHGLEAVRSESFEGVEPEAGIAWLRQGFATNPVQGIAAACVVPWWRPALEVLAAHAPLAVAGESVLRTHTRLRAGVQGLGADRWMAAEAAHGDGRAALAVTLGTATTFTLVDERGEMGGGAIAPGLATGAAALARAGAQLFSVNLEAPPYALGSTTESAMQSGLVFGHAAMVAGLVERLESEWGSPLAVVLTGGWSGLLRPLLPARFEHDPHLVLRGLARAAGLTWASDSV